MFPPTYNCYRDSQTTSDFELVHFESPKQIVGAEFYRRNKFSRTITFLGIGLAASVGVLCVAGGHMMYASKLTVPQAFGVAIILHFTLNLVVTACTDAVGFAHGIALRFTLASEKRLHFNTNLRLLSAASGWFNPNNTAWNIIMAILLIVSYSSSSLVSDTAAQNCAIPLIVLGVALLLQAVIAFASVWVAWTKILTWSPSPFDLTAALIHHTQITPVPGRCMLNICGGVSLCPVTPSPKQPSAWFAHPNIRKVVIALWALVVFYISSGLIIVYLSYHDISYTFRSWSFFTQGEYVRVRLFPPTPTGHMYMLSWGLYYAFMAMTQGPLTLMLHCSELVVNVKRDERMWRKATTKKGTRISLNPLASVFGNPLSFSLFLAKPVLHRMFGSAVGLKAVAVRDDLLIEGTEMGMTPSWIIIFAVALSVFSLIITIAVSRKPKGPQPAAYGHVQTLANLIDEFPSPSTMWWGDKGCEGNIRYAGTSSEHCLPEVDMNALYA